MYFENNCKNLKFSNISVLNNKALKNAGGVLIGNSINISLNSINL